MRKIVWIPLTILLCLLVVGAIVAAVFLTRDSEPSDELVLNIGQGPVRGQLSQNGQFYSFLGIPYGTVNITNRFKAPLPPPTWSEIREPVAGIRCFQSGIVPEGIEDCLIVNVFRPSVLSDEPLPVIVDIHGGGFAFGGPEEGADFLVQHDIVLVTVAYRLNIFGFLCTRTEDIPGNAGMKDQVAALRWVRDNIATFGGDPNAVTIIGNSAGAVAVDMLSVSPMSSGLFVRVIAQSGSTVAQWALSRDPVSTAALAATIVGANSTDTEEVNRILLSATTNQLRSIGIGFGPCIERSFVGIEPFMLESAFSIITSGRQSPVDIMLGFTDREGMMTLPATPTEEFISSLPDRINSASMPSDLIATVEERERLANASRSLYYGDRELSMDSVYDHMDFGTDTTFAWSIQRRIEVQNTTNKFYYYVFEYDGGLNMVKHQSNFSYSGACHADELGYLYEMSKTYPDMIGDERDMSMVQVLTKLWTNFAKYGNPTPEVTDQLPVTWLPVDGQQYHFLKIDLPLEANVNPYPERMAFWRQAYQTYFQDIVMND